MKSVLAVDQWSLLALARFVLAAIVAVSHLAKYADIGILSVVSALSAFEAILGFLLVSGYSVTSSYVTSPKGFFQRRLSRLYPVYIASVVLWLGTEAWVRQSMPALNFELLANLVFLNQLFTTTSLVGPAWSLSLEVWLYCLLPVLVVLGAPMNRAIAIGSFVAYLVYTVLRTLLHQPYYSGLGYGLNLVFLAFAWVCGSRLARKDEPRFLVLRDIAWTLFAHWLLAVLIQLGSRIKRGAMDKFLTQDASVYLANGLTLVVIYWMLQHVSRDVKQPEQVSRWMRMLGDLSYPWYLIHIPAFTIGAALGIRSAYLLLALSILMSWGMYMLFDIYSRRREIRQSQKSRPPPAQAGSA